MQHVIKISTLWKDNFAKLLLRFPLVVNTWNYVVLGLVNLNEVYHTHSICICFYEFISSICIFCVSLPYGAVSHYPWKLLVVCICLVGCYSRRYLLLLFLIRNYIQETLDIRPQCCIFQCQTTLYLIVSYNVQSILFSTVHLYLSKNTNLYNLNFAWMALQIFY